MEFAMTRKEWKLYEQQRNASYGASIENERIPSEKQDVFDWLAENETKKEKAEYARIMNMCVGESPDDCS